VEGDGTLGVPGEAPFDGIIVSAASPKIPKALLEQLAVGGKLVIPCGNLFLQKLIVAERKSDGKIKIGESIGCRFVPLIGKDAFN
jgi:protein-L-isoaspartate(D-aspartate) O-methyltransferase